MSHGLLSEACTHLVQAKNRLETVLGRIVELERELYERASRARGTIRGAYWAGRLAEWRKIAVRVVTWLFAAEEALARLERAQSEELVGRKLQALIEAFHLVDSIEYQMQDLEAKLELSRARTLLEDFLRTHLGLEDIPTPNTFNNIMAGCAMRANEWAEKMFPVL